MAETNTIGKSQFAIKDVFDQLIVGNLPFAIWRMPSDNSYSCVISTNEEPNWQKIDLEELGAGFAFAPFNYSENSKSLFIQGDLAFNFNTLEDNLDPSIEEKIGNLIPLEKTSYTEKKVNLKLHIDANASEKESFLGNVKKGITAINDGFFDKVVLSREKKIKRPSDFSPINHFAELSKKHTSAFCSITYLPWDNEIWIGATPESLVAQDADGIFKTMALAGTQPSFDAAGNRIETADALWRQKEIEEQAFVSRYIINCLKKIRVREYVEIGPKTINAGNLLHLQTTFEIDTRAIEFPQLGSVMLDLLHPTSAICGMPKEAAQSFIKNNETYDRSFYSGFLGPVNVENQTHLFVNLRTLKASPEHISFYAGCGITSDSNPEKEWSETEMKLKTVMA
ncbi:chorismate-binding protein [Arcticibacterium luteifluviistationis]|uniref:Isochorismate synthase n=1 Tax=Arcticibacterium luteifluviistationis TaxID=1784714 RepID=A0A2Z4GBL7_9BACT|nr:chorismate-binding protein [Arcticibacterium luteifluviistationis]AWV98323.1 isochorismate synthase [Arcticibacterium luteifluviistationis]